MIFYSYVVQLLFNKVPALQVSAKVASCGEARLSLDPWGTGSLGGPMMMIMHWQWCSPILVSIISPRKFSSQVYLFQCSYDRGFSPVKRVNFLALGLLVNFRFLEKWLVFWWFLEAIEEWVCWGFRALSEFGFLVNICLNIRGLRWFSAANDNDTVVQWEFIEFLKWPHTGFFSSSACGSYWTFYFLFFIFYFCFLFTYSACGWY